MNWKLLPYPYSFSGGIGWGKTPIFYRETCKRLAKRVKEELGKELPCLGSPYAGKDFSFPPLRDKEENGYDATSQVMRCGTEINDFNKKNQVPALLAAGEIPAVLRYGLDGKIYSSWGIECPLLLDEINTIQSGFIGMRVIGQKIGPPRYVVPWLEEDQIDVVITEAHIASVPALRGATVDVVRAFVRFEQNIIPKYCIGKNRQRMFWKVDATLPTEVMAERASNRIFADIKKRLVR